MRITILCAALLFFSATLLAEEDQNFEAAKKLAKQKQYDAALVLLDKVLETEPNHLEAIFTKADIYEKSGQTPLAIQEYSRCLETAGDDKAAKALAEKCKSALDRLDKAREIVQKYVKLLEYEARKSKDDYTQGKLKEAIAGMEKPFAGIAGEQVVDEKELRESLKKRATEFFSAVLNKKWDKALPYVDPSIVGFLGKDKVLEFLTTLGNALAAINREEDLDFSTIFLGEDKKTALIIARFRVKGEWHNGAKDPSYWVYINKKWYLASNEK